MVGGIAAMKGGIAVGRTESSACCCGGVSCYRIAYPCDGTGPAIYVKAGCANVEYGGERYWVDNTCCFVHCPPNPAPPGTVCIPAGAVVIENPVCAGPCIPPDPPNTCPCAVHFPSTTGLPVPAPGSFCWTGPTTCCRGKRYELEIHEFAFRENFSDDDGCFSFPPTPLECRIGTATYFNVKRYQFCGFAFSLMQQYTEQSTPPAGCSYVRPGPYQPALDGHCSGPALYPVLGGCVRILEQTQRQSCGGGLVTQHYESWTGGECGSETIRCHEVQYYRWWRWHPIEDCETPCPTYPPEPEPPQPCFGASPPGARVKGACCRPDGSCALSGRAPCESSGGIYRGDGTVCATANCPPPPPSACCLPGGGCINTDLEGCSANGGVFYPGVPCSGIDCTQPVPRGACCINGTCQDGTTSAECFHAGGVYQGNGVQCVNVNCAAPVGACCSQIVQGRVCTQETQADCLLLNLPVWYGAGVPCSAVNCDINPLVGTGKYM